MKKNITELINQKYSEFSKANKKLADFVKDNMFSVPFMSIKELANQAGVSEASVTRFTRELSFSGYAEFISCSRQEIQQNLTPWERIKRTVKITKHQTKTPLKKMIDQNIASLSQLYHEEFENNFQASVSLISKARRVYIIGARSSHSVALYLGSILNTLRDGVVLLHSGDFSQFIDAGQDDCLIAIGFARYTKITVETARYFSSKNCPVIAITDGDTSPLALSPEYVLSIAPSSNYPVADAMSIAMYLTASVAEVSPEMSLSRMEEMEKLGDKFQTYL